MCMERNLHAYGPFSIVCCCLYGTLTCLAFRHNDWALLHVYNSLNGDLLTSKELVIDGHSKSQPTLISPCSNGVFAVAFSQNSMVKLFDSEMIEEKASFRAVRKLILMELVERGMSVLYHVIL